MKKILLLLLMICVLTIPLYSNNVFVNQQVPISVIDSLNVPLLPIPSSQMTKYDWFWAGAFITLGFVAGVITYKSDKTLN